ncbi:zinc-ribbon domain-containing protein [Enterobacter bugandensis]|uniref:zinc-ribbon domain-containing protein n=1 Tax=Enterobacter bugandensis TaxID=881260 RepID=UPI002004DC55|nr:zinc-ribbon domain-containing protein [Enterobacter bugandensis]MCK7066334.1 zinc-ribbon domain-containing protein [Enterobacter bugandensis]
MYAQSFIAHDARGKLVAASAAKNRLKEHYTCHLCGSRLRLHHHASPPWFEHVETHLTENGRQHCPYVHPEPEEARRVRMLRRYVPDVLPIVRKAEWQYSGCDSKHHGELYCLTCLTCRTGDHSTEHCSE